MKKIFTLLSAAAVALAANAESITAQFGAANNAPEKDTEVTCSGFTIASTYVASGTSKVNVYNGDKGMKMRTNKTGNALILTVDENTTITALTMGIVTNDAEQSIPIIDVRVDGTSAALSYPLDTYNTTTADGSAVINLTDIEATENISIFFDPANYTAKNQQVFIAGEVTYEAGTAVLPTFPDSFDVTTNLKDINIWKGSFEDIAESGVEIDENALEIASWGYPETAIVLSGITDMKQFELEFDLPAGWLGVAPVKINTQGGYYNLNTRANDFEPAPLDEFLSNYEYMMGLFDTSTVKPGNPLTIPVTSEAQYYLGFLYLHDDGTLSGDPEFAGDFVDAANSVVIVVDVTDGVEVTEPTFPERLEFTMNGEKELEGVEVIWGVDSYDGAPVINVEGSCNADAITFTFTTPEGWTGFLIQTDGEVSNIENNATRAASDWSPTSRFEQYFEAGNSVTFETGVKDEATIALVWGDKMYNTWITLKFNVEKAEVDPAPEFPSKFDVTLSSNAGAGVELTTDDMYIEEGVYIINVTGMSTAEEITVTVAVPEGFEGFMHISGLDAMDPGIGGGPLSTRAAEPEWTPISELSSWGLNLIEGNSMTFPVDGQTHSGNFMLYKNGLVDINNQINVEFEVEYGQPTGVNGVNAADKAAYYDLQGNKISTTKAGMFVKVVNGKATKVVVK